MTTMTDEDLELEVGFVLWEAEDPYERPCETAMWECPNSAVRIIQWGPESEVPVDQQDQCCRQKRYCLSCFDRFLNKGPDDLIYCGDCRARTGDRFFLRILWTEAIRG